jgi:hypothetical protein
MVEIDRFDRRLFEQEATHPAGSYFNKYLLAGLTWIIIVEGISMVHSAKLV